MSKSIRAHSVSGSPAADMYSKNSGKVILHLINHASHAYISKELDETLCLRRTLGDGRPRQAHVKRTKA